MAGCTCQLQTFVCQSACVVTCTSQHFLSVGSGAFQNHSVTANTIKVPVLLFSIFCSHLTHLTCCVCLSFHYPFRV